MRRLQDEVTVNAGWLLRTIAQQTLEGVQPRGTALRALFAEQHRVPEPSERKLGALGAVDHCRGRTSGCA